MFSRLTLHGTEASLLWQYHTAAVLKAWRIYKDAKKQWVLTATVARCDAYQCRQTPLLFTAPRPQGFWAWGVEGAIEIQGTQLRARLGPPEQ